MPTNADAVRELARNGTAERLAGLTPPVRELHRTVLRTFVETGDPPSLDNLRVRAGELGTDLDDAVAKLAAVDMVHTDDAGRIVVAYPFSGRRTGHTVHLDGVEAEAMCAIDALGIPLMTGKDAVITAADPDTGQPVKVERRGSAWHWDPASTVVLVGGTGVGGTSAECSCPLVNFYTDAERATAHLAAHPDLHGAVLDQDDAVEVADLCFGSLLD